MTTATVCAVFFSGAAPFVPSVAGTPAEPSRKRCRVDSPQETAKMLAALEELLASSRSFLPIVGPSTALLLLLMTPPIADLSPVSPAVSVASATSFSDRSESFCSADSLSRRSLVSWPVPVRSPSVPAWLPAFLGPVSGPVGCLGLSWVLCGLCQSRPQLQGVPGPVGSLFPGPVLLPLGFLFPFEVGTVVLRVVACEFPPLLLFAVCEGLLFVAVKA